MLNDPALSAVVLWPVFVSTHHEDSVISTRVLEYTQMNEPDPGKGVTVCCVPILFCSRLCPSTAGSSPPPESSIFLCPLLSSSIPLLVAPQCHLSSDVLVFPTDLTPSVCHSVLLTVHLLSDNLSFGWCVQPISISYWTMSITLVLCLMVVLQILSPSLTLSILLSAVPLLQFMFPGQNVGEDGNGMVSQLCEINPFHCKQSSKTW